MNPKLDETLATQLEQRIRESVINGATKVTLVRHYVNYSGNPLPPVRTRLQGASSVDNQAPESRLDMIVQYINSLVRNESTGDVYTSDFPCQPVRLIDLDLEIEQS